MCFLAPHSAVIFYLAQRMPSVMIVSPLLADNGEVAQLEAARGREAECARRAEDAHARGWEASALRAEVDGLKARCELF